MRGKRSRNEMISSFLREKDTPKENDTILPSTGARLLSIPGVTEPQSSYDGLMSRWFTKARLVEKKSIWATHVEMEFQ